jgi:hypothetical protein
MAKLQLPSVTLFCADCVDVERAIRVLEHCKSLIDFGAVKFLTSLPTDYPHVEIPAIRSINDYSAFLLKEAWKYVDTEHLLTVQWDGWVLHPEKWKESWLHYDYIGPLYLQEDHVNEQSVGSGGFSFRSLKLTKMVADLLPPWDGKASYTSHDRKNFWGHEDGVITKHLRQALTQRGFKFAPPHEAAQFAYGGNPNRSYYYSVPFGFHGFYAIDELNGGTGDPSPRNP